MFHGLYDANRYRIYQQIIQYISNIIFIVVVVAVVIVAVAIATKFGLAELHSDHTHSTMKTQCFQKHLLSKTKLYLQATLLDNQMINNL